MTRNKPAHRRKSNSPRRRNRPSAKIAVVPAVLHGGAGKDPAIQTAEIPIALETSSGPHKAVAPATAKIPVAINAAGDAKVAHKVTVLPVVRQAQKKRHQRHQRRSSGRAVRGARLQNKPVAGGNFVTKVLDAEENAVNTAGRYTLAVLDTLEAISGVIFRKTKEAGAEARARVASVPSRAKHEEFSRPLSQAA